MSELTLDEVKSHLEIYHGDDDSKLSGFITAAETWVGEYLNTDLGVAYPDGWPAPVRTGALMMAGYFFRTREGGDHTGGEVQVPMAVRVVLAPYRVFA